MSLPGLPWNTLGDARHLREAGLFVAEGRAVVDRVVERATRPADDPAHLEVVGILSTPAAADALQLEARARGVVDIRTPAEMAAVTGFNFHRGVVALVRRPPLPPVSALLDGLDRRAPLVMCEHLADVDNIGSVFRNARALGAAAVLLDDTCADPL